MKKKLTFIGMILLALVLTTGTFAYTYSGYATSTLDATLADAVWTTYQPSAVQPNWDSILPEGEYNSEILRPNDPGDLSQNEQNPATGQNWDKVSDTSPDEWLTYIYSTSKWPKTDLYALTDLTEDLTISGVTVYFRIAGSGTTASAQPAIKTGGSVFLGPEQSQPSGTFDTKSYQWANNPATNQPWTTNDINQMQAGVVLTKPSGGGSVACTQIYVQVDYEFAITEGEVPLGHLYDINPHEDYTGDLLVKIYLTNTAELLKAYQYLNMKVYMANTLEAGKTPDYQVLSIETGVVLFNIEGGSAASYTVEITGGSYRLISDNPDEWGAGWNIIPEFYCEVGQR